MSDADFIKENIVDSSLVSFAIIDQFIELKFDNSKFHRIVINVDCVIESLNSEFERKVSDLKQYSPDVYSISYFVGVNLKRVTGCEICNSQVILKFEGEIDLLFDLSKEDSDFSISFWRKTEPNLYNSFVIVKDVIHRKRQII